ncbi:MAG: hypothetical protein AAF353_12005, partial [Pseudomonadota bacterium]
ELLNFYQSLNNTLPSADDLPPVSDFSTDMLEQYGTLRSGYEYYKSSESVPVASDDATQPEPETKSEPHVTNDPGPNQNGGGDNALLDLTVGVKHRPDILLTAQSSDPIIRQLIDTLNANQGDSSSTGLFYLSTGSNGVYFPAADLCSIDIEKSDHSLDRLHDGANGQTAAPTRNQRIAILVLGCLMPVYTAAMETMVQTWAGTSEADIDVFFILGAHTRSQTEQKTLDQIVGPQPSLNAFESRRVGNIILTGCADSIELQRDCLLRKRLIAFEHCRDSGDYDFVYTVCASSYVDQIQLRRYVQSIDDRMIFHGPAGVCEFTDRPYVSGASILMSMDLVNRIVDSKHDIIAENQNAYADDVALGWWVANHISQDSWETVRDRIKSGKPANDQTFRFPPDRVMVNYVGESIDHVKTVPEAFHYHFDVNHMESMTRLHQLLLNERQAGS